MMVDLVANGYLYVGFDVRQEHLTCHTRFSKGADRKRLVQIRSLFFGFKQREHPSHPRTFGDPSRDRRRQSIALFPPCFESHSLDCITFIRSWRILERGGG
jgi:hypothetical protein